MKKIKLQLIKDKEVNTIRTELKRYRVFLYWGLTNSFTNKKKAAAFQASLNAWINETFQEFNRIYAGIGFLYRVAWPFIDRDLEGRIINIFKDLDREFNKLYRSDHRGGDGAFWAFGAIENIGAEMLAAVALLTAWRRSLRDWESIKELDIIVKQINRILKEIKETADPGELGRQITRRE
jgi:hypothetical protein